MPETFDVVVIGSGFGGAITAARLARTGTSRWCSSAAGGGRRNVSPQAHRRVALGSSPAGAVQRLVRLSASSAHGGRAGRRRRRRVAGVREHLRQCASPTRSRRVAAGDLAMHELAPHYRRRRRDADVQKVPANQWPERTRLMKEAAEKNQLRRSVPAARPCGALRSGMALRPAGSPRGNPRQDVPQRAGPGARHVRAPR